MDGETPEDSRQTEEAREAEVLIFLDDNPMPMQPGSEIIDKINGFTLKICDLNTFSKADSAEHHGMLSEAVINFALQKMYSEMAQERKNSFCMLDTSFFRNIITRGADTPYLFNSIGQRHLKSHLEYTLPTSMNVIEMYDVFDQDLIMFPISLVHHVMIAIILNPKGALANSNGNIDDFQCRLIILDSARICTGPAFSYNIKNIVVQFLMFALRHYLYMDGSHVVADRIINVTFDGLQQQDRYVDCGIFAIANADLIIRRERSLCKAVKRQTNIELDDLLRRIFKTRLGHAPRSVLFNKLVPDKNRHLIPEKLLNEFRERRY